MPRRPEEERTLCGAKLILFLYLCCTFAFIVHSIIALVYLKHEIRMEPDFEKKQDLQLTHACQARTLSWIIVSAANFVGFIVYLAYLSKAKMPQLSRLQRSKRRMRLSLVMALVYVPY